MDTKDYKEAAAETLEILQWTDKKLVNKIPLEVIKKLNVVKSDQYTPKYNNAEEIQNAKINAKTRAILAFLYKDYICTEEEKKNFMKKLYEKGSMENNPEYEIKKLEKKDNEKQLPVVIEKNFFKKIIDKIFRR